MSKTLCPSVESNGPFNKPNSSNFVKLMTESPNQCTLIILPIMVAANGWVSCFDAEPKGMLWSVKSESFGTNKKAYRVYCINA